jgi:hypothetical protein
MRWWQPNPRDPELLDWWRPLLTAARRARLEAVQWPIHPDEFELVGRVVRGGDGADVWIYRHETAVGFLCVDAHGSAYRFDRDSDLPEGGSFAEIALGQAVWAAGLAVVDTERRSRAS